MELDDIRRVRMLEYISGQMRALNSAVAVTQEDVDNIEHEQQVLLDLEVQFTAWHYTRDSNGRWAMDGQEASTKPSSGVDRTAVTVKTPLGGEGRVMIPNHWL